MNHEKKENKEIKVKLIKIQETVFFIDSPLLKDIDNNESHRNFDIEIGLNLPNKNKGNIVELKTIVRYYHLLEQNSENKDLQPIRKKVLELETSNLFEFDDIQKYVIFKNDTIEDSSGVIPILLGVSIGAMRGILVTKTIGTCLSNHPLPIINTEIFMKSSGNENNEKGDISDPVTDDFSPEKN